MINITNTFSLLCHSTLICLAKALYQHYQKLLILFIKRQNVKPLGCLLTSCPGLKRPTNTAFTLLNLFRSPSKNLDKVIVVK